MNELIYNLLNFFLIFTEDISLVFLCETFFIKKFQGRSFFFSVLFLVLFNCIGLAFSDWNSFLKVFVLVCIDTAWVYKVFSAPLVKSAVVSILFLSFITAADNLFFLGAAFVSGVHLQTLLHDPYGYYLFCYFAKLLDLFVVMGFRVFVRRHFQFDNTTWQNWLKIFIFPAMSLSIAIFLWRIYCTVPFVAKELLLCTVGLLAMNLFAVAFLSHLNQQEQLRQDNIILQHNIKAQNEIIAAWSDAYRSQRKMTHDFQNQLSVICGLAEHEAPDSKLLSYVQSLLQTSTKSPLIVKSGRQVADVLFSQKYSLAREKDIEFSMQLDDLTYFSLDDTYLVVLLSNLIDNAIEACDKIPEGQPRTITVKMQVTEDGSFLYIENTTAVPVKILDNQVVISPYRSKEHGYGLRTVMNILNQSGAVFAFSYRESDRMFCFSAQIP